MYKHRLRTLSYGHLGTINRRAALFFLLYLGAILYLSLYPWRFQRMPLHSTLAWVPLYSRRTLLDAGLNVVFYVPLGAAAFLSVLPARRRLPAAVAAFAAGTLASYAVERAQLAIPGRFGNLTDLACNSLGTLAGVILAFGITKEGLRAKLSGYRSPKLLLVGLWLVWQAFLFLPRYGPATDLTHEFAGLLFLALLAASRRIGHAGFMLSAPLAILALAADELRPFRFEGPPQPFWWVPFESWFVGAPDSYYGSIFGKLFFDAAILWMERRAGIRWRWGLVAPGAVLLLGELAQTHLPGRTPEITDLALLAAAAVMLSLAERPALG